MIYPNKKQSFNLVVKLILAFIVIYTIGLIIPSLFKFEKDQKYDELVGLFASFALIPIILYAKKKGNLTVKFEDIFEKFDVEFVFIVLLASFVSVVLFPLGNVIEFYKYIIKDEPLVVLLNQKIYFFKILELVLIAPIFEEILFRRIILKQLMLQNSAISSLLFSSFLFAIAHAAILSFLYYFIASMILGFIFYKTNSLLKCIVFHSVLNITVIILKT